MELERIALQHYECTKITVLYILKLNFMVCEFYLKKIPLPCENGLEGAMSESKSLLIKFW